ncbi:GABA transporter 1-like protein [Carex littledalei]|uniref:GABA transporter 1-like protein n=1 Tax=Carex littledalei TaxID=544730 RepID=A0A833VEV6_9POAL|nr:GABA transporter 1-like protein [Carex littledalei]
MGTLDPNYKTTMKDEDEDEEMNMSSSASANHHNNKTNLDAGALFVLQSKGSWIHCGYHMTTAIVAPALLSLPFAFASLGWAAGVVCLVLGAAVSFYSYNLISHVLQHHAQIGRRQLRFRDMANDILGPGWGRYYVGPIQFAVCFGAVVGSILLAGQSMKAIYLIANPEGSMELYQFIIIFGVFSLVLAQMPSFHSLRHVNLISLVLCLAYSLCATAGSIYIGHSDKAPTRDYSVLGSSTQRTFGTFNAIAIIATTFGNGIIPEIQATISPPVTGKMFKGLGMCYTVVIVTFFSVSVSGYWAFGNKSESSIISNFMADGVNLAPEWLIYLSNIFPLLQLSAVATVYLQPTNDVLESLSVDATKHQFSARNVIPRILLRSAAIATATTIAAMLPFFGDINAILGAFGFMPLDFVLPSIFYNITFKPSRRSLVFWLNTLLIAVFTILTMLASISAVRQIALDAKNYKLFANV